MVIVRGCNINEYWKVYDKELKEEKERYTKKQEEINNRKGVTYF